VIRVAYERRQEPPKDMRERIHIYIYIYIYIYYIYHVPVYVCFVHVHAPVRERMRAPIGARGKSGRPGTAGRDILAGWGKKLGISRFRWPSENWGCQYKYVWYMCTVV